MDPTLNRALVVLGVCVLLSAIWTATVFVFRFLRPAKDLRAFGEWAIVTGATDGIGQAMAMELAKKGMNVMLISRSEAKLEKTKSDIQSECDVRVDTLAMDCARLDANILEEKLGDKDIGVLVNNVGVSYDFPQYFHELSLDKVQNMLNLNMEAATLLTRMVLPRMVENKRGAIVNVSSGSARLCVPLLSVYSASKRFLEQLTSCLAAEYAPYGISIQCHNPLFVTTKLAKIRKQSLFVPSPETYAKHAVRQIGYDTIVSPYWPHAMQSALYECLPTFLIAKISMSMHQTLRRRALKKIG